MRCSAVLLAGGKSTRMGRDKALLEYEGEALWRRQLATLRRLSPAQLLVSGPPRAGVVAIADEFPNAGPLAGIAAALQKCAAPYLVVLAVDLPLITSEFLQSLLASCRDGKGAVPQAAEFFEPLAAIYPACCSERAERALRGGEFSLQKFVRAALDAELLVSRPLRPDERALFKNLNTPEDL